MKLRFAFWMIFFFAIILAGPLSLKSKLDLREDSFKEKSEFFLSADAYVRGERITSLINEMEDDTVLLSKSYEVKDILQGQISGDKNTTKFHSDRIIKIAKREIENYLKVNPQMTLEDLKNSNEFKKIVFRSNNDNLYSVLFSGNSKDVLIHPKDDMVGLTCDEIIESNPSLGIIFDEFYENGFSFGFYNWTEEDGSIREKYIRLESVNSKTRNGVDFILGVTNYIDKNIIAKNISLESDEYIKEFMKTGGYSNILIANNNTNLIYDSGSIAFLGNTFEDVMPELNLEELDISEDRVNLIGPVAPVREGVNLALISLEEVLFDGEILGYVILSKDIDSVEEILGVNSYGSEKQEVFLVREDRLLASKMKFKDVDVLVQEIKTDAVDSCMEKLEDTSIPDENNKKSQIYTNGTLMYFLDYKGDEVLGIGYPISNINLCLMSEINVEEMINVPIKDKIAIVTGSRILLWVFLLVLFIVSGLLINKNALLVKKKDSFLRSIFLFGSRRKNEKYFLS